MPTGETGDTGKTVKITMALANDPDDIQQATDVGIETVTMRRMKTA